MQEAALISEAPPPHPPAPLPSLPTGIPCHLGLADLRRGSVPGLQAVLSRATRGRPKAQPGAFRSSASHQLPPPCQEWERPEVGSLSLPNVSHIYTISMNFPFLPVKVINISFIPKVKVKVKSLSRVRLSATPWTVAQQAPPSMGFSRQEYWNGFPFSSPSGLLKTI